MNNFEINTLRNVITTASNVAARAAAAADPDADLAAIYSAARAAVFDAAIADADAANAASVLADANAALADARAACEAACEALVAACDAAFAARAASNIYNAALADATKADEQAPDLWDEILPGCTHTPPSLRVTCPRPREIFTVVCPIANDNHEIIGCASYDYQLV